MIARGAIASLATCLLAGPAAAQTAPAEPPGPPLLPETPFEELPAAVRAELAPPAPPVSQLPEAARELMLAAMRAGDDAAVRGIARAAKATYPLAQDEVADLLARWDNETKGRADVILALAEVPIAVGAGRLRADELDPINPRIWKGRGELGGFRSTGSTSEFGVSANVTVNYSIGRWTHKLQGTVDYRRSNGLTSQENLALSYEPRLQWSPGMFFYGLAQYERAPLIGYESRYTASGGIGAVLLDGDGKRLLVTTGPAFRAVDYVTGDAERSLGLRSSLDFDWRLSPTARFTHAARSYVEDGVLTLSFDSGVSTQIAARLSSRLSYTVQVEHVGEPGDIRYLRRLDTMSRVSLVYDF